MSSNDTARIGAAGCRNITVQMGQGLFEFFNFKKKSTQGQFEYTQNEISAVSHISNRTTCRFYGGFFL
ncbi:MAG: hypothetical protein JWR72_1174 [Flavisolibacter sp.]|nr:hypothetical protein [Flavisolibacter sp.]